MLIGQYGEVGFGIRAVQVRAVVQECRGVAVVAARLGVTPCAARALAGRAGVTIRPARRGQPERITRDQVHAAVLSEAPLSAAARSLGVTPAGLHRRARSLGLPTDPAGRAAYRLGVAA